MRGTGRRLDVACATGAGFGRMLKMFRNADKRPEGDALTPRERQLLDLLAQGLSNKEIGLQLNISPCTVKNPLARVFEKLQARCRTAAVMAYLRLAPRSSSKSLLVSRGT